MFSASLHMPMCPGWPERVDSYDAWVMGDPCPLGGAAAVYGGSTSQRLKLALDVYV